MQRCLWLLVLASFFVAVSSAHAQLIFSVEGNYLYPGNQDVVLGSDAGSIIVPGVSGNDVLDAPPDFGFQATVAGGNWRASWRWFNTKSDFFTATGRADVALNHPGINYGAYTTLNANGEITLNVVDLDLLMPITTPGSASVSLFGGLRYVGYENTLNANYDAGGQIVNRSSENQLFGIRGGVEFDYPIFIDNLSVKGGAAVSLMAGESKFNQTQSLGPIALDLKQDVVSPGFEVDLALNYSLQLAHTGVNIWAGYEFMQFNNAVYNQNFVDDINDAAQVNDAINAGFHGVKFGASVEF